LGLGYVACGGRGHGRFLGAGHRRGIALVRQFVAGRNRHPSATRDALSEAERILADRFTRGEIDEDEFRRRSALLRSGR
jgi:hypothetical protein